MMARAYQGNGWWIAFALFALFMMVQTLLSLRTKRKAGFPISTLQIIRSCGMWLFFVAIAVYQVLTH
jgi:hypothetical protein